MKRAWSIVLCFAMALGLLSGAVFATPEMGNPFTDVKESDYFYDAVMWAVEYGVTTGTSATTFSPNASCTRAQVVTFLWRSAGCPMPAPMDNPFKDVPAGAYYYDAVMWAVGSNITTGTSATTFSPDASCTRAQVVTFMWRASGQQEVSSANPFTDVSSNEYYYNAVLWAVDRGITTGLSATSFGPNATCTRAQIVTFLYRFMGGGTDEGRPLTIFAHPEDYRMRSSQEDAEFLVQVSGGTAPYTFRWVVCYDDGEVMADPVTSENPINEFSWNFSDYDFDDHRDIGVYCLITDATNYTLQTRYAEVIPYYPSTPFLLVSSPSNYEMTATEEIVSFTVKVSGGSPEYAYRWYVFYDDEVMDAGTVVSDETTNTLHWGFSDSDFDDAEDIGAYCVVTDYNGNSLTSGTGYVLPYPLTLLASPEDYSMSSSMEDASFMVEVEGGAPAYTYDWIVVRDGEETCEYTEVTDDCWSEFTYTFSDYDFDDYWEIYVYCIVTDENNDTVISDIAFVIPH